MTFEQNRHNAERAAVRFLLDLTGNDLEAAKDRFECVAQSLQEGNDELGEALANYTDPKHSEYDPEFDKTIRALRPDWFDDVN